MKYLILAFLFVSCAKDNNVATVSTATQLPKVLIIGDSISMGYTSYVQKDLKDFYNVQHVHYSDADINSGATNGNTDQNAQGTTFTSANLDRWLAQAGPVDVIVWNNGLWNARNPITDPQAPGNATDLATYQSELTQIGVKLLATNARVLFFTSTDIPSSGSTFLPGRDIQENQVAQSVLPSMGIEVYDLHALAISNPKLHLSTDPIHFNSQGYSLFGEFISDMIKTNYEFSN